eukprot:6443248-Amphidinium_carterae.1
MAASASQLPAEADGEPADVLASFYFEATKAKVHELRQQPDADQGLSTVEVEVEACLHVHAHGATQTDFMACESKMDTILATTVTEYFSYIVSIWVVMVPSLQSRLHSGCNLVTSKESLSSGVTKQLQPKSRCDGYFLAASGSRFYAEKVHKSCCTAWLCTAAVDSELTMKRVFVIPTKSSKTSF